MLDRRKLFALGGAGIAVGAGTGALGAEVDPAKPGITVQIRFYGGQWEVVVPDWEHAERGHPVHGYLLPVKWIPLTEFLGALEGQA